MIESLIDKYTVLAENEEHRIASQIESHQIQSVNYNNLVVNGNDDIELTASQIIGGQKVVCIRNGQAAIASNDEYECFNHVIGVTKGAVDAGQTAIIKPAGLLNGFSGLIPGAAYYMGLSGAITAEPPTSGIWQQIGIAKSDTELIINISNPSWRL